MISTNCSTHQIMLKVVELVVELVVEEGERVVEVVGVLGLGLWSGEATWLVFLLSSFSSSFSGFDVAHEARRGEPSCVCILWYFHTIRKQ